MTDEAVSISITIKVEEKANQFQNKIPITELEEGVQVMTQGIDQQVLKNGSLGCWMTVLPPYRLPEVRVEYSEAVQKPMPIFLGPDQTKPWVRLLSRFIHGR
jgi:hypothetical protein